MKETGKEGSKITRDKQEENKRQELLKHLILYQIFILFSDCILTLHEVKKMLRVQDSHHEMVCDRLFERR